MPRLVVTVAVAAASAWLAAPASAADVVVVRPTPTDSFIDEIFHRVNGELRVHSFGVKEGENAHADVSLPQALEILRRAHADACIFFSWRGETSVVHVWVAASNAPPALFEAVALQRSVEVPTKLAARAVDLLTAALDMKNRAAAVLPNQATSPKALPPAPPTPSPSPAGPSSTPAAPAPAVSRSASPTPTASAGESTLTDGAATGDYPSAWALEAGTAALGQPWFSFSPAWSPVLAVGHTLSRPFRVALRIAAPLLGAAHTNAEASAHLVQAFALAELQAEFAHVARFTLSATAGLGAYFLNGVGTVHAGVASIEPGNESRVTGAGALGMDGVLSLSSRWSAVVSGRALFLLPRPRISVGREDLPFGAPLLTLAVAARLAF